MASEKNFAIRDSKFGLRGRGLKLIAEVGDTGVVIHDETERKQVGGLGSKAENILHIWRARRTVERAG